MFIALLPSLVNGSSIVNASSHTKYVSLSNQKCEVQPTNAYILMHTAKNYTTIHLYVIKLNQFVRRYNTYLIKYVFQTK